MSDILCVEDDALLGRRIVGTIWAAGKGEVTDGG